MIDWNYYRSLFPVTENHIYFQTAGAGPIPTPVLNSIVGRYNELATEGGGAFQENIAIMERCRQGIAKLINADSDDIAFIPNVSFGMNALSNSLTIKSKLFIPAEDFPASIVPWINSQFPVEYIQSSTDLQNNIIKSLEGSSKSLITSFVQYSTGYRSDLDKISQSIFSDDSMYVVNATQGIGVFPIDVKKSNIDALICACHKWMFCGEGIAFMYIKPTLFKKLKPAIVGWRSSPHAMQFNEEFKYYNSAKVFEIGWPNMTIFAGLATALDIIFEIGVENIATRVLELMNYLVTRLENLNIPIIGKSVEEHRSGIILLGPFDDLDNVLNKLHENNIYVTKRGNGIRIALHFYNNQDDIDALTSCLNTII
jgi:cysteine desulfurase/selenocysteine lyase